MQLPYKLPGESQKPEDLLIALLIASAGASILVTHRLAARTGFDPSLGAPMLAAPWLLPLALLLGGAAIVGIVAMLSRSPRSPAVVVLGTLVLPLCFALSTRHIYQPLSWVKWRAELAKAERQNPRLRPLREQIDREALVVHGIAVFLALLSAVSGGGRRGDVHGSARFATSAEIARLGLRKRKTGVVVGGEKRWGKRVYLHAPDRRHVGIFGPSGCGKTTKVVIPTLLTEPASMVVLDIKGELYHLTAEHRRRVFGHKTYALAPSIDAKWVAPYNPLLDIPKGDQEVGYAQAIAQALIDPEGKLDTPDFWHASAQSLLTAAILHVLHRRKEDGECSLTGVSTLLAAPEAGIKTRLKQMQGYLHDVGLHYSWRDPQNPKAETPTHPVVSIECAKLVDLHFETLTGIIATARSKLSLFLDPIVAKNTRTSELSFADLGNPAEPKTIYLMLPARDIARLSGLLRLLLQ